VRPTRGRIVRLDKRSEEIDVPAGELAYVVVRHEGRFVRRYVVEGPVHLSGAEEAPGRNVASSVTALPASAVSVVVATRDRPEELASCLAALAAHASGVREIVVCDSASSNPGAIADVVRGSATLVRCESPGLSLARNTGASRATGDVIAFLDDDCLVEPGWLDGIRAGFSDDRVAAVTGSYIPFELQTEAQLLFLRYAHMDKRGFESPVRFSVARSESKHWPLDAWRMGSGGNMAVRAETFRALGGFRLDLGLGSPARGGEDLFLLWSIVRAGLDVVYRPDAMVSHRHHRDVASLHRVLSGYGVGHAAYLAAARAAGAAGTRLYAASVLYDRAKRAAAALFAGDRACLALVRHEVRGLLGREKPA